MSDIADNGIELSGYCAYKLPHISTFLLKTELLLTDKLPFNDRSSDTINS